MSNRNENIGRIVRKAKRRRNRRRHLWPIVFYVLIFSALIASFAYVLMHQN